jgi:cyclopropane fatty-acyl-phospholipid synthase-like methyltransferase
MNNYIGELLNLNNKKKLKILDAGCGIGGTSIYLAKRYPNVKFTGITITPGQQKLAKKYAKEKNLKNVNFYVKSYLDTGYLNNYFDGIFGLESINYASDKKKLVDEVYRILKPGGRFVTVDAFFTKSANNPIMKKIHDFACIGRGMALENDLIINEYKSIIEKKGFRDIQFSNISKNVWKSQARSFTIGIPYLIKSFLKYISINDYDFSKDSDYYLGASVICGLYGLTGAGKYCSFVCRK